MFRKIILLENLIYVAIFGLPLYLIHLNFYFLKTNLLEILISLILLIYLFQYNPLSGLKKLFQNYSRYVISFSFILLGLLIATFLNSNSLKGLGIIKSWFLIPVILVLIIADIFPPKKIINIFLALYLSAFSVAILALIYLFLGHLTYDRRLESFFNSPNYLAMYLTPAILIAGVVIEKQHKLIQSKKILLFILISLSIILTAFYFTYSYAAWLSVLLIIGWIFLYEKNNYFRKILFLGTLITLLIFSQIGNNKFSTLITFNPRSSLASRIIIWRSALKMLQHSWLIGIGPGNFQKIYLNYQKFYPPYLEWAVPHPQNFYLTLWLSSGLLGLGGFFMLLFYWFQDISFKLKRTHLDVLLIMISLVLVTLTHGLVDTTYFKNDLAIIFWLNFLALKF